MPASLVEEGDGQPINEDEEESREISKELQEEERMVDEEEEIYQCNEGDAHKDKYYESRQRQQEWCNYTNFKNYGVPSIYYYGVN